jgi:hypothetical protein
VSDNHSIEHLPFAPPRYIIKGIEVGLDTQRVIMELPFGAQIFNIDDKSKPGKIVLWAMLPCQDGKHGNLVRTFLFVRAETEFALDENVMCECDCGDVPLVGWVGMWRDEQGVGHVLELLQDLDDLNMAGENSGSEGEEGEASAEGEEDDDEGGVLDRRAREPLRPRSRHRLARAVHEPRPVRAPLPARARRALRGS